MYVAAIIDQEEVIVPIVEGVKLRIYDTETGSFQDYENPALGLTEGRRGATLRFAIEKGAAAFASPPQTFCELSYEKAVEEKIRFFHLEPGVAFNSFKGQLAEGLATAEEKLPGEEIAPSFVAK